MANGESLSGKLVGSAKSWAAKNIAEKDIKQREKESTWAGIMSLLKPVAGLATKGALGYAGIGSSGLLAPLLLGLGTSGFSKAFDWIGRKAGAGADPSKIEATGKYGFGEEYATTLSEGLEQSIAERDPLSGESIASDVIGSYVSALTPKFDPRTGKITGGELGKDVLGAIKDKDLSKLSMLDLQEEGLTQEALNKLGNLKDKKGRKALMDLVTTTEGVAPDTTDMDIEAYKQLFDPSSVGAEYTEIGGFTPSESFATDIPATMSVSREMPAQPDVLPYNPYDFSMPERSSLDTSSIFQGFQLPQTSAEKLQQEMQLQSRFGFEGGGQVPAQPRTIADYFGKQGVTLGGSNKQSLAEMLGRR